MLTWKKIHNANTSMSYNALTVAGELGINRVVMASSVNAIGLGQSPPGGWGRGSPAVYSKRPHFDYLPVDESHPCYPEDAYSISKLWVLLRFAVEADPQSPRDAV